MTLQVSVVIPVYNEAGNILPLVEATAGVLAALPRTFEILLVDDGSTDATPVEIAAAEQRWPQCRALRLPRQSGQAAALLAGLRATRGGLIATLDGDGQNDPRDLPQLLALVEAGACDVACGWRIDRYDTWLRRAMSRLANTVRRAILHDGVHDAGCQLRVFRKEVCAALFPIELLQSFLPAIAAAAGFRVAERPVRHHPRRHGESKYGIGRLWWRPALTMLGLWWRLRRRSRRVAGTRSR
ncbi:MAG TPA: glycosyltransferase [Opitutaceae bacterium]